MSVSDKVQNVINMVTEPNEKPAAREVLPTQVTPTRYFVSLAPDLDEKTEFVFEGKTTIDLRVNEETNVIVCNAAEITFQSAQVVQGETTQDLTLENIEFNAEEERVTFRLASAITPGEATLSIQFQGILNDKMKGFYRSKTTMGDKEIYWGVTQFESTDARRAFPCWDEPALKATFIVELTVPADYNVLSNMPEQNVENKGNVKTVLFDESPIMSTYLLAWVIGKFDCVEARTNRDTLVRVWAHPERKDQCHFACTTAVKCLEFYEQYFEIDYPLPKSDMIAIPDFAAGAMENWGLVTYRETALLCDDKSAVRAKQWVALVVCHELAHQWFGNLVTMDWWSQLWLNEGFACFMEYLSSDAIFPEWKMWNMFVTREYDSAFQLDAMETSHPIEVDVQSPAEVDEIFDAISYCKGAAVIRMIESFLGGETFRMALKKYLNNFRYANAVTEDLWNYLSMESNKQVATIMQSWTREQGYPLIDVTRNGNQITLKQKQFLSSGGAGSDTVWTVPIVALVAGVDEPVNFLLEQVEQTFDLPGDAPWVKLNAGNTGFYCVKYDETSMTGLSEALQNGDPALTTLDRLSLIRDTLALAKSGVPNGTTLLLNLISSFGNEQEQAVWDALLLAASDVRKIIDNDTELADKFSAFMRKLLTRIGGEVGWTPEEGEDVVNKTTLRPQIVGALCKYDDEGAIANAKERFAAYIANAEAPDDYVPVDLRGVVFSYGIKYGGTDEFNQLRNVYNTTKIIADKQTALMALGASKDAGLLQEALDWIRTDDNVRPQDKVFPFRSIAGNPSGRQLAWEQLQMHWDEWYALYDGGFLVQHLAKLPSSFVTMDKANEVEAFYATKTAPSAARAMKQAVENIRKYAAWRERDLDAVRQFFS